MQIKFDPSATDESHSIEIPAMVIEGREQCDKIVASLQKRAAVLWPKPRAPRTKTSIVHEVGQPALHENRTAPKLSTKK